MNHLAKVTCWPTLVSFWFPFLLLLLRGDHVAEFTVSFEQAEAYMGLPSRDGLMVFPCHGQLAVSQLDLIRVFIKLQNNALVPPLDTYLMEGNHPVKGTCTLSCLQ